MDMELHPLQSVKLNNLSIHNLQRRTRWSYGVNK